MSSLYLYYTFNLIFCKINPRRKIKIEVLIYNSMYKKIPAFLPSQLCKNGYFLSKDFFILKNKIPDLRDGKSGMMKFILISTSASIDHFPFFFGRGGYRNWSSPIAGCGAKCFALRSAPEKLWR